MEFGEDVLEESDCVVMAAAAGSGEGKEGDARWFRKDFRGAFDGLGDDFEQLVLGGVFAGGHVGEEIKLVAFFGVGFLHDGEARKGRISRRRGGIIRGRNWFNL